MDITSNSPIGLFDSGLGGLTLLREVRACLPREDAIYFGDLAHMPYGDRSLEEIEIFATNIISYLIERGVKAIVIACNTSSSVLLDRPMNTSVIVENLIPTAVKGAIDATRNKRIGMIANPGTCASKAHETVLKKMDPLAEFFAMPCPKLVPLIEAGKLDDDDMNQALEEYLPPLVKKNIDTLIMGCTHYPLAFNAIRRMLPSSVAIVDPAHEAAHELRRKLVETDLVRNEGGIPSYEFNLSAPRDNFQSFVENYLAVDNVITKVVNLWQTEHTAEPHACQTGNSPK